VTVEARRFHEFLRHAHLDAAVVQRWVASGWLEPQRSGDDDGFSEVDIARAHLICDLQRMGVNDDGIPIILDLVDQLHGVRRTLRNVLAALEAQSQSRPDKGKP
jgi:chaperone modulatory protein CbpM